MVFWGALGVLALVRCGGRAEERARVHSQPMGGTAGTAGTAPVGGEAGVCSGCGGEGGEGAQGGVSEIAGTGGRAGGAGSSGSGGGGGLGAGTSGMGGLAGEAGQGGAGDEGVALTKLAVYQAVEVPLMSGGRIPARNAALVAGRRALVRAWLTPSMTAAPRALRGTLTLENSLGESTFDADLTLAVPSTDAELGSTLDFEIPAALVSEDAALAVTVFDAEDDVELARWPVSGKQALAAEDSHGPFVLSLVPLVVAGHVPDLSIPVRKRYERLMRAMYPVPDLVVTVHGAVTLSFDVLADGTGWDEALDELYAVRAADDPAPNAYYYGVLTPRATSDEYCPRNCTVGLSVVAGANEELYRGSIGTGYFDRPSDTFSPETMAHELGHALGRDHSPCGTTDSDPRFPYGDGFIGSWGYDGSRLRNPAVDTDVMGYCVPVWISDYTYDRLFTRIAYVNGLAPRESGNALPGGAKTSFRTLVVRPDGTLRWGRKKVTRGEPPATKRRVELLDANGRVLATIEAPFARFDHLPGGFLTLPSGVVDAPGVASLRVGAQTLRRAP